MSKEKEIRDLFDRHGVTLARTDVWAVQGNPVVHHKALERLAATIGIKWKPPQVLRAERDEAVILVTGELAAADTTVTEWSIGEALIGGNYRVSGKQAAYVYAMAEKRGKDRVIIKLAGLHGVYSDEEADDFRQQPGQAAPQLPTVIEQREPTQESPAREYVRLAKEAIDLFGNAANLGGWWRDEAPHRADAGVVKGTKEYDDLHKYVLRKGEELADQSAQQREAAE